MRITGQAAQHGITANGPDVSTIAGVQEMLQRVGLNPYHYFVDEIASRVREAIQDGQIEWEDDGLAPPSVAAVDFFEWVYEADKGPYGPNLYENNPGEGMPDVWTSRM